MAEAIEIFCDESGYNGPDLLHDRQPYFAYAAVAIEPGEARELLARVRRAHLVADPEIKATTLAGSPQGMQAMLDVLSSLDGRFRFVTFDKRLALCGKLFEYVYEPVFQDFPGPLYRTNLHRFTAMYAYNFARLGDRLASTALEQFQAFMRERDTTTAPLLFGDAPLDDQHPFSPVIWFARGFKDRILADRLASERKGDPSLDLGASGLWSLLTAFGEGGTPLAVTCDESPILKVVAARLRNGGSELGRSRVRMLLGDVDLPDFTLARDVDFQPSTRHAGLQLADVVAGAATMVEDGRLPDSLARKVTFLLKDGLLKNHSVGPQDSLLEIEQREPMVNWLTLMELGRQAQEGVDPVHALAAFQRYCEDAWNSGALNSLL